ncbi:hypothetical protein EVAR_20528_1 [Eumeta japonica]|uniref:Uncharacterized protein n=1 Tax=Eumeta variegata TaxID=151549 RepID=A0A4C1VLB1_EUMVA|nr:hypothetical protein EVAR_20528_1 [Eumeta japonica]
MIARDYSIAQPKWVEGHVRETVGPASYNVELPSRVVRRHVDQILLPGRRSKRHSLPHHSLEGEKSEESRDPRTKDVNETRDAVASSGVQSEREAARESCEVHSRIPAPAREVLVEAEASKEATEERAPVSSNVTDLYTRTLRPRRQIN